MEAFYTEYLYKELQGRIARLQQRMQQESVEACLITTNVNLYYFLGRVIDGCAYITQTGNPWIFIRRPVELAHERLRYIRKVEQISEIMAHEGIACPAVLMLENDEITYSDSVRYKDTLRPSAIKNSSVMLRELRSVKSAYELSQLRLSAKLQSQALLQVPLLYRPGMSDHDLSVEIERAFRQRGCLGLFRMYGQSLEGFMGSVLAGNNALAPSPYDFALGGAGMHPSIPWGHRGIPLEEGMSVMVDINGNFTGYIADCSRVFSVGRLTEKAYYAHHISLDIQQALAEMGREGVACEDLYLKACDIVEKHNLQDCFMGAAQKARFVGHGVGLVINELPVLCKRNKTPLIKGQTIAIEPKFVLEGVGAVGTENTYVVGDNGLEKITNAPEEIIEL